MKRDVAMLLLLLGFAVTSEAGAVNRSTQLNPITLTQISQGEWTVEFKLPSIEIDSIELSGTTWSQISSSGLSSYSIPGAPDIPCTGFWLPANARISDFELLEQHSRTFAVPPILPTPLPLDRIVHSSLMYLPDEVIYTRAAPYPGQLLEVIEAGHIGKSNLTLLRICPLQFVPATGALTVYDRLVYRVTLPPDRILGRSNNSSPYEPQLISDLVQLQRPLTPPTEITTPKLLVVTIPEFVDALQEWQEFKRTCGVLTEVVIFSEVASNSQTLRAYLQSRYENAETPPEFLFIVGDYEDVPAFYGVGSSLTDHPYSCLSGEDYLPDIAVGRLPVTTFSQLSNWLTRALLYERDGEVSPLGSATVFSSSVALDPQHGQQVNSIFQNAGLATTALQQPQTGALPLLINSLNNQPLWTFYIGHGNAHAWSSVAPQMTETALQQLQNNRQGIVVSVACATADFDEGSNCIAEDWNLGVLSGGALCYIGATESTAFFYSDTIGLATLEAVFDLDYASIGKALDYGKLRCAQSFPQAPGGLTEETIQQFVLFGDPSLRPFTGTPIAADLQIPETLPVGTTHIPVRVTYNSNGVPNVEVVLTSLSTNPIVVLTDSDGFALVELPFTTEHNWTVTTRGLNVLTNRHEVSVIPVAGPILQLLDIEMIENVGDSDGLADRGESGILRVLIRNAGTATSEAGTMRLECSNSSLSISPTSILLPAFEPQTEEWLDMTSNYSISTMVEDGTNAAIQAWIGTGQTSAFVGSESIVLHAPRIELVRQWLSELSGDGDLLPESGEQLMLSIALTNRGGESLRSPVVDCNPDHQYLHIQDTRWTSDTLDAYASDTVTFIFQCDSITPRGYAFEYSAALSGENLPNQELWGHFRIGRVPALLYVLDSQPQQVTGIQGALQVLGIEYETCSQLPPDLSRYSSIWIFCGVHPNQEALSQQSADRIADYLIEGGCCYWEGGDVWAFDYETSLHAYFGIDGVSDGTADAGPVTGVRGRFTDGMQFNYGGENSFIDRIRSIGSGVEILTNTRNGANYTLCVANAGPSFRTIGCSIELGALSDAAAPSTRVHLIERILEWFEIPVLHDLTPPSITHIPIGVWQNSSRPIPIFADVQDESGLEYVACDFQANGGMMQTVSLHDDAGGYSAFIPAQAAGTRISYRLRAVDRSSPQNTAITDEFALTVQNHSDRLIELIPGAESLNWMRKRGGTGVLSLSENNSGNRSVVLMSEKSGRTSAFVTETFDLSNIQSPRLEFQSIISGVNSREPVTARIIASTDGGVTFPHLVWRNSSASGQCERVQENDLSALSGKSNVVFKFLYYANSFWEITCPTITDQDGISKPVRSLVVKPGSLMSLHWAPSDEIGVSYRVFAASSLTDQFLPIAHVSDTFYSDKDSQQYPQRFYRVLAVSNKGPDVDSKPSTLLPFSRISISFDGR